MSSPRYLTVKEVSEIFRRSVKTIYRWIELGDPIREFVRVKDGVLIPQDEIDRILAEGRNADISDIAEPQDAVESKPRTRRGGWVNSWKK